MVSSAGNEGESVDVLGFIVLGLSKTFFSGKEIVNLGFSPVVGGLCTPFAVFRTSAGLGVDDGTHVELVRSTRDGNLMRGGIKAPRCQPCWLAKLLGRVICRYPPTLGL